MATKTDGKIRAVLARPYMRRLLPDEQGGYTAYIHEFPGCVAELAQLQGYGYLASK